MTEGYDAWVVLARNREGKVVPTACSDTEAGAYQCATHAVEVASLMLTHGLSDADYAETMKVLDSIKVLPARIIIEGSYE